MSKRPSDGGGGPAPRAPKLEASNGIKDEDTGPTDVKPQRHELLSRGIKYPRVMYKEGEPMAGLQGIYESAAEEKIAEVVIPADYMNSNTNRRVKTRQLWGDRIYTGDSDPVAVLMHLGYFAHYLSHPPAQVLEFHALLRLLPPQSYYPSKARFVKSRAWCSVIQGCSYQVECCWLITRANTTIDLEPSLDEVPAPYPTVQSQLSRQMQTRSTGRHVMKVGQEVSVQFNLCNEPWLKYTLPAIADRGTKPSQWTSSSLLDDVLLLETMSNRYQIARTGTRTTTPEGSEGTALVEDLYSLSKCKEPLPMNAMRRLGLPLPHDQVEVMETDVAWEEFKWGVSVLNVRARELPIKRMHFAPKTKDEVAES